PGRRVRRDAGAQPEGRARALPAPPGAHPPPAYLTRSAKSATANYLGVRADRLSRLADQLALTDDAFFYYAGGTGLASRTAGLGDRPRRVDMRMKNLGWVLGAVLACGLGGQLAVAEDQAPPDPTRGQWDSFLDPLRDFEDNQVVAGQKWI